MSDVVRDEKWLGVMITEPQLYEYIWRWERIPTPTITTVEEYGWVLVLIRS